MKNLELYLHIPFCVRKCSYCDFLSFSSDERTQGMYADALMREIRYYGAKMQDYRVSTIYIGGGSSAPPQRHVSSLTEQFWGSGSW